MCKMYLMTFNYILEASRSIRQLSAYFYGGPVLHENILAKEVSVVHKILVFQYIRFHPGYNVECLFKMMEVEWCLSLPQVLVTVAGGAQGYNLDAEVGRQFKKGLVDVANNNDIWITTGGTDYG